MGIMFSTERHFNADGKIAVFIIGSLSVLCLVVRAGRKRRRKVGRKAVFITGCDSGIGYSLALHSYSMGFHVFAGCLIPDGPGAINLRAAGLEAAAGGKIEVMYVDIRRSSTIQEAKKLVQVRVKQEKTELWAVVNNAGVLVFGDLEWLTEQQIVEQVDVNLTGAILVTKYFSPLLRKSRGRLINVSSACAHFPLPSLAVYCATKCGLEGLTEALRIELRKYGIDAISLAPGDIPGSTNLFGHQKEHAREMEKAMTAEDKELFGDYFQKVQSYITSCFSVKLPSRLEEPGLYRVYEDALLATEPRSRYENCNYGVRTFFVLFGLLPMKIKDKIVQHIMRLPSWP